MEKKPKLIICGHARHGKDTMAEYLQYAHGFSFDSSSHACLDLFLFDKLKDKYGYKSKEECYEDRVNHRAEWYDLITEYCSENPAKLAEFIFDKYDIYVGIRNPDEFEVSKKLADLTIWVDRGEHLPPEDISSNGITEDMCDITIDNNGSLEDFFMKIDHFLIYKHQIHG